MTDIYAQAVELHQKYQGKLEVRSRVPVANRQDLSLAYSPGVAEPSRVIAANPAAAMDLTWRGRTVAVISDGSAVLGLGNIGPLAALPVMEGKAVLLKEFGGVDAVPIVIDTQDSQEIIKFVKQIAPSFAGINLEDIAAPRCFEIEEALQDIGIPVFHDDQHGTAIVVAAALHNAAKVVGKTYADLKVVIIGAGAAGLATTKMLLGLECMGNSCQLLTGVDRVADVIVVDSVGAIEPSRTDLNANKQALVSVTNQRRVAGSAAAAVAGADVVIGVSKPGTITPEMIKSMAPQPIVFAMANPTPEIMPDEATAAGAVIVATGRSDYPNQINNVLAFPGVFKAVITARLPKITTAMKIAAARALAGMVSEPTATQVLPEPFNPAIAQTVAEAIVQSASPSA